MCRSAPNNLKEDTQLHKAEQVDFVSYSVGDLRAKDTQSQNKKKRGKLKRRTQARYPAADEEKKKRSL